jgi:hypothetical protein
VIDQKPETGWAVEGHVHPADHQAVFAFAKPYSGGGGTTLTVRMHFESTYAQHLIGKFRLALTTAEQPKLSAKASIPKDVFAVLAKPKDARSPEEQALLAKHYRGIAPALDPVRQETTTALAHTAEIMKQVPTTMIAHSVEPRVVRVLPRGNWMDESGEVVEPAAPAFLPHKTIEGRRATRLDLAQWLVDRKNPLTARAYVNRLWKLFYGTGISKRLEEMGSQGGWPAHPELLDWLAVEFMDSGWDVKHVVRLMVTASAYRQSSNLGERLETVDPENRLIARQSSFRLEAEFIRDNALAIGGLLSANIGGPSVYPYQPDGYNRDCNTFTGPLIYTPSMGEDQYRRGLYTVWKRSFLHPSLLAFDAPSREECAADRPLSNTPLQALALLDDPTYLEAARCFAARILKEGGATFDERVTWAYRRALDRAPSDREKQVLADLCGRHMSEYERDATSAREVIATGQAPVEKDLASSEFAAWTSVARVLLNLHETITRS